MNREELREHLDQLSTAIDGMNAAETDKLKLSNLITDIEGQLSEPQLGGDGTSLVEQVEGMVSGFESDHPTVTGILNNIIIALSSMGV